ncbi:hypothetical protein BJ980_002094 [Nocardioides daedukensis]|uniref:Uncharacterized protein n=1 Tax=Nocardioides daedukensis TaxID=634462 RepID=A0A7Y9UR18_9ACTN|nr:hypothetical protein [Nocardioides daedukensis]NYG59171.1 hypothetical protein [Nocardioides daedukensis]
MMRSLWLEDTGFVAVHPRFGLRPKDYQEAVHARRLSLQGPGPEPSPPLRLSLGARPLTAITIGAAAGAVASSGTFAVGLPTWTMPFWVAGTWMAARATQIASRESDGQPVTRDDVVQGDRARAALGDLTMSDVISMRQIPDECVNEFKRLITLANFATPEELDEALARLHREATRMVAGTWRDPVAGVIEPEPPRRPALPRDTRQRNDWAKALIDHDAVEQEWAAIVLDRFAVLEVPLLLDVKQPETAAFIDAYARAQDFRAVHGRFFDPALEPEYVDLVRAAVETWTTAQRTAREVGLQFLPKAEQSLVRKAIKMLAQAEDPTRPVAARVHAARRAARLLAKVHTVVLPK